MDLTSLHQADGPKCVANTPLGQLAAALRRHFCDPETGILLQARMMASIFPAFASLSSGDGARSIQHYREWVTRLGTKEYADELLVIPWTR